MSDGRSGELREKAVGSPGETGPRVGDLPLEAFESLLKNEGAAIRIGPFDGIFRVRVPEIAKPLHALYADHPLLDHERVFSFHLDLREAPRWFPWQARKVRFTVDGRQPHEDMPREHALTVLEWGVNLILALRFHRYLMLHAAVLARGDRALLMPAAPGHGKTTLCAALALRGWRLFSDEFGLVLPETGRLVPVPRPMPLKNASIEVIGQFAPEAIFGPAIPGTMKGTVRHLKPPASSVAAQRTDARAAWVVFPRWESDAPLELVEIGKAQAFMLMATNAFNYELLGEPAFENLRNIVEQARCFRLRYSRLTEAIAALSEMADAD